MINPFYQSSIVVFLYYVNQISNKAKKILKKAYLPIDNIGYIAYNEYIRKGHKQGAAPPAGVFLAP